MVMVSADSLCVRITLCDNEMPVYHSAHWSISGLDGFAEMRPSPKFYIH